MNDSDNKRAFGGCVLLAGALLLISLIGLAVGGNELGQFRFIFGLLIIALILYYSTDIVNFFKNNQK